MAVLVDEHVLRLDVAVHDAEGRVEVVERERDLGNVEAGHVLLEVALEYRGGVKGALQLRVDRYRAISAT